jgi:DNA-binding HxlR family transcriptional regulator
VFTVRVSKDLIDLKTEMEKLRIETTQRLDLIEHQLNKHVTLNYMKIIVDYMTQNTISAIKALNCPKDQKSELECKEWLVNLQNNYINKLRTGKIRESNTALTQTLEALKNDAKSAADQNSQACVTCLNKVSETVTINSAFLGDLNTLTSPLSATSEELNVIHNINPTKLETEILSPVAHSTRLKIMLSIFQGNSRFTDFTQCTNLAGGHLLYHIKLLSKHGLIAKDPTREYRLTLKGIRTLALLTQLGKEEQPT